MSEYIVREIGYPGAVKQEVVAELVRCKDCKCGHKLTDANGYNYRTCNNPWGHGMMVEEYGFCKWGERRDDGDGEA